MNPKEFGRLPGVSNRLVHNPLVLADVGARGGLPPLWHAMGNQVSAIGFEPDKRSYEKLVSSGSGSGGTIQINSALYSEETELTLNLAHNEGDSSIYPPNKQFLDRFPESFRFNVVDQATMSAITLDAALEDNSVDRVDFIKLDTQGSELEILKGGSATLKRGVLGIEVEVEFNPMYEGQALFGAIDEFLRPFGFELFDLAPTYWKQDGRDTIGGPKGQIIYADALYLLAPHAIDAVLDASPDDPRDTLLRFMQICLIYGYLDYALVLADRSKEALGAQLHKIITEELSRSGKVEDRYRWLPLRGRIAFALRLLAEHLQKPHTYWRRHGSDRFLGNPNRH